MVKGVAASIRLDDVSLSQFQLRETAMAKYILIPNLNMFAYALDECEDILVLNAYLHIKPGFLLLSRQLIEISPEHGIIDPKCSHVIRNFQLVHDRRICSSSAMYIESVPNRNSPPAVLLRESYRENGRVRKRTLCNLSDWPAAHVEAYAACSRAASSLRPSATPSPSPAASRTATSPRHWGPPQDRLRSYSLPDGHRCRDLVLALIVAGSSIRPRSWPPPARSRLPPRHRAWARCSAWARSTRMNSTPRSTGCWNANPPLRPRSPNAISPTARSCSTTSRQAIWKAAAARSPSGATAATVAAGRCRSSTVCCVPRTVAPVAIEVFEGNTADPMTLAAQVDKLKQRFHLDHVVLVGDRGMITQARISEDIKSAGLDWITALRAPAIKALLASGALQLSLFDQRDMASITAPEFPGERLVVCRNPDLAAERARKRADLLAATEYDLSRNPDRRDAQAQSTARHAKIALAVGAVLDKHRWPSTLTSPSPMPPSASPARRRDRRRGGNRWSVCSCAPVCPPRRSTDAATVRSYKSLARVERAFRCIKTVDLQIRPCITGWPTGSRACLPLHAGVLCRMAHPSAPGADAVR